MKKILILYHSNGGYTKRMAEYVQQAVAENGDAEIRCLNTEQAT